jgi:hypothetical protein
MPLLLLLLFPAETWLAFDALRFLAGSDDDEAATAALDAMPFVQQCRASLPSPERQRIWGPTVADETREGPVVDAAIGCSFRGSKNQSGLQSDIEKQRDLTPERPSSSRQARKPTRVVGRTTNLAAGFSRRGAKDNGGGRASAPAAAGVAIMVGCRAS